MQLTGKNIIAGELKAAGDITFTAVNPASSKGLAPAFHEATGTEISAAAESAAMAFQIYSTKSGDDKAIFLEAIADEIMALGETLIQRCVQETGLPEARLIGERARTCGQLKLFAQLLREGSWIEARIDRPDPDRTPAPKPDVRSMLRPIGPVAVFGASNFPLAFSVAGGDTTSALAAGCPVIFKAHPSHPGTSELTGMAIRRAVSRCGMPEGTFSMLHGKSTFVGLGMVRHPAVCAVGFTGSFRGGKALFDEAARREIPIPVYAEMGSSNPVFILPEAMRERHENIARDLANSVTLGTGQFCTSPGLVFLTDGKESSDFKVVFSEAMQGTQSGVMLSDSILSNYLQGVERRRTNSQIRVLAEGAVSGAGCRGGSALMEISGADFLADKSLEEEIFGPSSLVVSVSGKLQLMQIAETLSGHLTATIHGTENDLREFAELIPVLERKVGRILINGYPTGVEVCHAMVHGGPFPATSDSRTTSVGTLAIKRFSRPVCYQNFPEGLLPDELKTSNPKGIIRLVDGQFKR